MAKKAAELSDAAKAVLDIRQKIETAKKNDTAKSTDATKKAIADLEASLKTAIVAENRDRFVRVGGGRVKKARAAIRNLANVAAPRSYTYDESDVAKLETVLSAELSKTVSALRAALANPGKTAKAADDFTF